ncbi:MAG: response regulator transcription factor, partial [Acidimicrobiaceae bacterium]|nr:response regulator transcription factor [Acidimicrobiaceae bacterium]
EHHPSVGVVVLSQYATPAYAHALFEQGSDGRAYLLKDRVADVDEVVYAIDAVARGGSVADLDIGDGWRPLDRMPARSPLEHLTSREREILSELATGKSNVAIANSVFLSERAIEKHSIDLSKSSPDGARCQPAVSVVPLYRPKSGRTGGAKRPSRRVRVKVMVVDDQLPFRAAV